MKIAFYKGKTRLFNRLVSWYLRGNYSHCEAIINTTADGYSLCASSSFMDGGVRLKFIKLDPEHWDVVDVPGSSAAAYEWTKERDGDGYDLLGLLGFAWRRQSGDKTKWFCSESVAAMLGLPEPWRFDPMTLWAALSGARK